jgi:HNH endonuclease
MTKKMTRPAADGTDQMVCRTDTKPTSMRVCNKCGEQKAMGEMAPDRHTGDGCRSHCRECRAAYDRRRYLAKRESILAQQREYRQTHPEIGWAASHRRRAQRYGLRLITDVVTTAQLIAQWGDRCLDCTGEFEVIDHRLPVAAGGHHTVLNVVPCCRNCNARKRWTFDERIIRARRETWAGQAARSHHGPHAQPHTVRAVHPPQQPPGSRGRS